MVEYLLVAVGGGFGSIMRFIIGRTIAERISTAFPIGTFIINITGAFLLGIVSAMGVKENVYALIAIGFLGAFTTFSTFMYEGFNLFQDSEKLNAFIYILGSLVLGIIFYVIGFAIMDSI